MKLLIVLLSLFTIFQNSTEHTIVGTWNTLEDNTTIQIIEQKGILFGRIKASDNPKAQVGRLILKDLIFLHFLLFRTVIEAMKNL